MYFDPRFSPLTEITRLYRGDASAREVGLVQLPEDPNPSPLLADFFVGTGTGIRFDAVIAHGQAEHALGTSADAALGTYQLAAIRTSTGGRSTLWMLGAPGELWNISDSVTSPRPVLHLLSPSDRESLTVGNPLIIRNRSHGTITEIVAVHHDTPAVKEALKYIPVQWHADHHDVWTDTMRGLELTLAAGGRYIRFDGPAQSITSPAARVSVKSLAGAGVPEAWSDQRWSATDGIATMALYHPGAGYRNVDVLHSPSGSINTSDCYGSQRRYESVLFELVSPPTAEGPGAKSRYLLQHNRGTVTLLDVSTSLQGPRSSRYSDRLAPDLVVIPDSDSLIGLQHMYELSLGQPCRPVDEAPPSSLLRRTALGATVSNVIAVHASPEIEPDLSRAVRVDEPPFWNDMFVELGRLGLVRLEGFPQRSRTSGNSSFTLPGI